VNGCDVGCTWTRTVDPTVEPVLIEEVKAQARITDDASDGVIEGYIKVAREEAEKHMGRGLLTQTWKLVLDGFAWVMPLPMASPLASVTSVKYYDTAGVLQTLATTYYDTDTVSSPGTVTLKPDQAWPSVQSLRRNGAVEITYVVGWTTADLVPQRIKQGILQYATFLDADRNGMEVRAADALIAAQRCWDDRVFWNPPTWEY
jgi:uncharacterized phiE125 gp8 family phage protein